MLLPNALTAGCASTADIDAADPATVKKFHGVGVLGPEPSGSASRTKRMTSAIS
jgi:hypothetical protein